jgi:anti-sigma factor RsiW
MQHLSDDRLLTLSLGDPRMLDDAERAHVRDCDGCAERLATDRQLSGLLRSLPAAVVPPQLHTKTVAAYLAERRRRGRKTMGLVGLGLSCAAVWGVVALPAVVSVLMSGLGDLVAGFTDAVVAAQLMQTLLNNVPGLSAVVITGATMSVLVWSGLLARAIARPVRR